MKAFGAEKMTFLISRQYQSYLEVRNREDIPQCVTVRSVGRSMQMIHSTSANFTGLFDSSCCCCLIASACCFARNSLYSSSFSISTRSTTSAFSPLGLPAGVLRELLTGVVEGRALFDALTTFGLLAFRFLGLGAMLSGGGEVCVKSTTLEARVVF